MAKLTIITFMMCCCASSAGAGPCDIFDAAPEGTPCVAAHSTVRALYSKFAGPLYQVLRMSDNSTKDIPVLSAGGFADSKVQDAFCAGTHCFIWRIYDQSPKQNHLDIAPLGGAHRAWHAPVSATKEKFRVGGHPVYAAYLEGGMGYRIEHGNGIAKGNDPETLYAVFGGKHYNGGCGFEYGNAESNNLDTGAGSKEAIYFGSSRGWGHGDGAGPWVMADMENGLWAGNEKVNPQSPSINAPYVTTLLKGRTDGFTLKGGDAALGTIGTLYEGPRPRGSQPMKKQGSIILGIGGDNSDSAHGTFYEGVMTAGSSSDVTDARVVANIAAAGYGKRRI